jgi:enoyl-CoA hydratase
MSGSESEILFERRGSVGLVTLNRPRALNAVTLSMVRAFAGQLDEWARDAGITRIVVSAAGDRAFSAGGDIRALYDLGRQERYSEMLPFWREEYTLNAMIKRLAKPYVALVDGIAMGGGVGLSVHGSHRVAGDRFLFAMPEVGIGFFPDVGATWLLPRLPGALGSFLALTGDRLRTADGVAAMIATHHVRSDRFAELRDALCSSDPVDAVLAEFAEPVSDGPVLQHRKLIDRAFVGDRVIDILSALDREAMAGGPSAGFAAECAATVRTKSPTSLKITLEQMRRGRTLSFEECMQTEFRIVSRIIHGHDFYEGVRAVIVDKDNDPRWVPSVLAEVTPAEVERHFAPLGLEELVLP